MFVGKRRNWNEEVEVVKEKGGHGITGIEEVGQAAHFRPFAEELYIA